MTDATPAAAALKIHCAPGLPAGREPGGNLTQEQRRLCLMVIGEEVGELVAAMVGLSSPETETLKNDLVKRFLHEEAANYFIPRVDLAAILKEACDAHVAVAGTLAEYGLPLFVPTESDAKPDGWRAPDLAGLVA